MGNIILFHIGRNKCQAMITSDEQLSGVVKDNTSIWSVGRRRRIVCQNMHSGTVAMAVQEREDIQLYSDLGITFNPCFNKEYLIYNCGLLKFNIFHKKSRKLIKKIDISVLLQENKVFSSFSQNERIAWRYCVGRIEPKLFIVLNRYHPHLIIFDYLKGKVEVFVNIFSRIDWKSGPVVPVISLSIMITDLDDYIFFVNQLRDQKTKEIDTYFRVITRNVDTEGYNIQPTRKFPSRSNLLAPMSEIISQSIHDDRGRHPNQIYMTFGLKSRSVVYCFLSSTEEIDEIESIQKSAGSPE